MLRKENDPMNESSRFEEAFSTSSEAHFNQLVKGYAKKILENVPIGLLMSGAKKCALSQLRAVSQRLVDKIALRQQISRRYSDFCVESTTEFVQLTLVHKM